MSVQEERNAVQEEVESLTIHGWSRVSSAQNKYARMIWLLLCISASIAFGIIAVNSFIKFYQHNTLTHRIVKQNSKLALPGITFCHTNFYHPRSFIFEDPPVFQHLPENCSFNDRKYFANNMNKKIFDFACQMFIGTFKSKTSAMGTEIPHYLRFPKGFELTPNKEPCITLNRNSTLVQQAVGEIYGVHMILYNQYFKVSDNSPEDEFLIDRRNGIYATIHDPKQMVPIRGGILIPSGYHTHISVTKNIFKRLRHPYPSKCIDDWSNHGSIYPGKNTQHMCFSSCAHKQMYKMCLGVKPEMKVFMKASEFPIKVNTFSDSFKKCQEKSLGLVDFQKCNCNEHCYEEAYTTVIDRNPWPQYWQAPSFVNLINNVEGKINRSLSTTEIRKRLVKVTIYYDDFTENIFEERPLYDLLSIFSDLGGQMGLFMGASLLSLAEIIALVATYVKRYLCRSKNAIEVPPQTIN